MYEVSYMKNGIWRQLHLGLDKNEAFGIMKKSVREGLYRVRFEVIGTYE